MNWESRGEGLEDCHTLAETVAVADLRDLVLGLAVPASEKGGEGCLLGVFGRLFDDAFPQFPMCSDIERLLDWIGVRASQQVIKSIVVANDDRRPEEAWQLLVDTLGGLRRRLPVLPSAKLIKSLPDCELNGSSTYHL